MTTSEPSNSALEDAYALLQSDEDFRVIRRLQPPLRYVPVLPSEAKSGIFLDIETTGLDHSKDEIIEIALVPFFFSSDGELYCTSEPVNMMQEPTSGTIPEDITRITGITLDDVKGHAIDWQNVRDIVGPAAIVVAHNAAFDRPFLEKAEPFFSTKAWACSLQDVRWQEEGFESGKLEYLAYKHGFFYDGHRATIDCYAGLHLLHLPLASSRRPALHKLLENARMTTFRIWAENAPFNQKDDLKRRGYRWNDGSDGRPKAWYFDVPEADLQLELSWLRSEIYRYPEAEPLVTKYNAFDRYSNRI